VSSPVRLLGELLRRRLAEASGVAGSGSEEDSGGGYLLQMQVDEFSQVFDAKDDSRAIVRARAALLDHAGRQTAAQRFFTVEQKAPSPDAAGAVAGLAAASRQLADEVVAWVAETAAALPRDARPADEPGAPR
jgi:cholesterol transport system auxiliary component